jgi:uncharacterized membrane protein
MGLGFSWFKKANRFNSIWSHDKHQSAQIWTDAATILITIAIMDITIEHPISTES